MKKLFGVLAMMILATRLPAQSDAPARLALIAETSEASVAADVLTAQLSGNPQIQLLERNEIEKVFREQGLSAGNRDYLKLGRILGADGLLLLDVVRARTATNLAARLVAAKPGVILLNENYRWPMKDITEWTPGFAKHLNPLLPKLLVLAKDAIPISVVNLRSAVQSAEAQEAERQLKLLTLQRLSQEHQFFVLERQRMQLLSEEKELKADEAAFWNGSYLLEGVVDQSGYSRETITLNGRLTPPKGAAPILFDVSGSRTNLAEVVNQLVAKVNGLLRVNSSVPAWNAADEAQQYLGEAGWALKWGIYPEAQMAAESAWALGKKDLDCAVVRTRAYVVTLPRVTLPNVAFYVRGKMDTHYVHVDEPPQAQNCDAALYALRCYYDFCQTSPDGEPKILSRGAGWNDWHDSEWYRLGIETLEGASYVLQHFYFRPESQKPVGEKLSDLRRLARSVAEFISQSPSVHGSYFVGDRIATHDELGHTIQESPNIFNCEVNWGCFWQEKPEEAIALYRELMSSPVFCYIHGDFWRRSPLQPRLVAWKEAERGRLPGIWGNFVQELSHSTNVLLQVEAKALALADANDTATMAAAFTNLFNMIFDNRDAFVTNNVELLYLNWGADDLVNAVCAKDVVGAALKQAPAQPGKPQISYHTVPMVARGAAAPDSKSSLQQRFYSEYRPKLDAMNKEYWNKTVLAGKTASAFEKQKRYLAGFAPYDFRTFNEVFSERDYTKAQAAELQPLIAAYNSNMIAQASAHETNKVAGRMSHEKFKAESDAHWIRFFLEARLNKILNPPAPRPPSAPGGQPPKPVLAAKAPVSAPAHTNAPERVTNVMSVRKFLAIPRDGLEGTEISQPTITAHHWQEGKLVLDLQYQATVYAVDQKGAWRSTHYPTRTAIAILDPATEHWSVINGFEVGLPERNSYYHRTARLHGELFTCDGGQIRKYDFQNRQWHVLDISDGNNYELFAVNGRLYAADENAIFEIVDGGKATRMMASTRRRPPMSALDTETLGTPTLFAGPHGSLRAGVGKKVFTWMDKDWREDPITLPAPFSPEIFAEGILFHQVGDGFDRATGVYFLATESSTPELWFRQEQPTPAYVSPANFPRPGANAPPPLEPLWKLPADLILARLPAAVRQADLYLLADHSTAQNIVDEQQHVIVGKKILPQDGYHAALLCYSRDLPEPQKLFLRFDAPEGCPPVTGNDSARGQMLPGKPPIWLLFTPDYLLCGLEKPDNILPGGSGRKGCANGIWLVPLAQIEAAVAEQKQIQLTRKTQERAQAVVAAEQTRKNLLAKYDRNHDGFIEPNEREEALDDPVFIESELDNIDTNHNGWLNAAELVWFDANGNKMLEPKEQTGIELAQQAFAARLLAKFDSNGDGWLDRSEFDEMNASAFSAANHAGPPGLARLQPSILEYSRDGNMIPAELERFVNQRTRQEFNLGGPAWMAVFNQFRRRPGQPADARQLFKASVEFYWQNPGSVTNRLPGKRSGPPGGEGFPTNSTQNHNNQ
jgi:hypothetical protein